MYLESSLIGIVTSKNSVVELCNEKWMEVNGDIWLVNIHL